MNQATHALTMNGRIHVELKDRLDSPEEVLRKRLALLDGTTRYSLSLWRLPDGLPLDRVDLTRWPQEYVQAAGSRERLAVEVRRLEEGGPRQLVAGRPGPVDAAAADVAIPWDGHVLRVLPSEVFGADEAADLFVAYYDTGTMPDGRALRRIEV